MGVANLIDFGFPCNHETNEWSTEVLHFCRLLSFLLSQRTIVGTTLYSFAHCIQLCQIWVWFISSWTLVQAQFCSQVPALSRDRKKPNAGLYPEESLYSVGMECWSYRSYTSNLLWIQWNISQSIIRN
jgi:hypothetical protein